MSYRCPIHGPIEYIGQCCDPDVHGWDCECSECRAAVDAAAEAAADEAWADWNAEETRNAIDYLRNKYGDAA